MIIMYSDYNPEHAGEKLEADCFEILMAALFLAGLDSSDVHLYEKLVKMSANSYTLALGEPEDGQHTEEQWQAAIDAAAPWQAKLSKLLKDNGITISNKLIKAKHNGYHYHIQTHVYGDGESCCVVAQINRPIVGNVYIDNITGFGADYPEWPMTSKEKAKVTKQVAKAVANIGDGNG